MLRISPFFLNLIQLCNINNARNFQRKTDIYVAKKIQPRDKYGCFKPVKKRTQVRIKNHSYYDFYGRCQIWRYWRQNESLGLHIGFIWRDFGIVFLYVSFHHINVPHVKYGNTQSVCMMHQIEGISK